MIGRRGADRGLPGLYGGCGSLRVRASAERGGCCPRRWGSGFWDPRRDRRPLTRNPITPLDPHRRAGPSGVPVDPWKAPIWAWKARGLYVGDGRATTDPPGHRPGGRASSIAAAGMKAVRQGRTILICDLAGEDLNAITPEVIVRAAKAGDTVAREILEEAGSHIEMTGTSLSGKRWPLGGLSC